MQNNLLLKITTAPFAVLILHIFADLTGLYENYWWMDIPLHFLGGVAIAIASYFLLEYFTQTKKLSINSLALKSLIIISLVALSAISWEFLEYFLDFYFATEMQPSILDTMKDLAMGLFGGFVVIILNITNQRTKFWQD